MSTVNAFLESELSDLDCGPDVPVSSGTHRKALVRRVFWLQAALMFAFAFLAGGYFGGYLESRTSRTERSGALSAFAATLAEKDKQIQTLAARISEQQTTSTEALRELRDTMLDLAQLMHQVAAASNSNLEAVASLKSKIAEVKTARTAPIVIKPGQVVTTSPAPAPKAAQRAPLPATRSPRMPAAGEQ